MSTSQHVAEVVVRGQTDGVSTKLKEVADGTEKVKKAADAAGDAQEGWGKKLDALDKRLSGFQGSIDKVNKVLGAGGLAATAMAAGQAIGAMAERANQVALANQALKISIQAARDATMGMVADYDLTVAANKAVSMGVVKTDREFAALAKTAAKLGLTMGQDAGKSVDDLTTALARQSPMILDNLGITMKVEEANATYAARIGKVTEALTDAEKKQAFMTIGLEKATEAADKANVSLDTHAAQISKAAAQWTNLKDDASTAGSGILVFIKDLIGAEPSIGASAEALSEVRRAAEKASAPITDLRGDVASIAAAFGIARSEADQLSNSLFNLNADQLKVVAAGKSEEDQARAGWLAYKSGNEELRKSLALEERRDALSRQKLEIDTKKKRGKGKKTEQVDNLDRFADQTVGVNASRDIADSIEIQKNNEALVSELQLREDRITLIEREQELAAAQAESGLVDADLQEQLADRKFRAEQDLLDFQIAAAVTRDEILDLELAKRRQNTARGTAILLQAQAAENKALLQKRAAYERYGGAVGDVMGQVTTALIDSANGSEYAAAKALAAIATGIRNQMIMESLKEFALAVASAASYNYPAAAQHATAGGLAAAAAVVAGSFGAGVSAAIPSEPSTSVPPSSGGIGSERDKGGSSSSRGGGDDDGVPTSYYDGGLYSKRPTRMPQAANGGGSTTNNITVLGATTDQVALALRRVQDQGKRSLGSVK